MMGGFVAAIRSLTNPQGESHQAMSMPLVEGKNKPAETTRSQLRLPLYGWRTNNKSVTGRWNRGEDRICPTWSVTI